MRLSEIRILVFLGAILSTPVSSQQLTFEPGDAVLSGKATVLGSDLLEVAGSVIRLDGIQGIEFHQFCYVRGNPWSCGASAVRALQTLVDPVDVTCLPTGHGRDEAILAKCAAGGIDVAALMVADGWALPIADGPYTELGEAAEADKKGVWQSAFVAPSIYRDGIAQIERHFRDNSIENIRAEAEAAITDESRWAYVLENFKIETVTSASLERRQVRVADLQPGFVDAAIGEQDIFDWRTVADNVRTWKSATVAAIKADSVGLAWAGLRSRPGTVVAVHDALQFYNAMRERAQGWIDAGRQPVLLVKSPLVPSWIRLWFDNEAPPRAHVQRKSSIGTAAYLGTIEGIDVYVGDTPDDSSALLPADLLETVTYGRDDGGNILAVSRGEGRDGSELIIDYSVGFSWRDDTIVWLKYPQVEADALSER